MNSVRFSSNPETLERLFGQHEELLPLWIAEPDVRLAPVVCNALADRSASGWFGYESRPSETLDSFWAWMKRRHNWEGTDLHTLVSPSVGTSISLLLEMHAAPGSGVLFQPPVFTDFKTLIQRARCEPVRCPLLLDGRRYLMDLDALRTRAAEPNNKVLILCNPHNPVGRAWSSETLRSVAEICSKNDVFVIADEIHGDLVLPPHRFVPFASVAAGTGVRWASTHGAIKTFGLAGVADTLLITDSGALAERFRHVCGRLHLNRNNVFSLAATRAAYDGGDDWLDAFHARITKNFDLLDEGLPEAVRIVKPEATYLAWLDFRQLGMDVPELAGWLVSEARLALSPGHWFGREGAGFARMTVAVEEPVIMRAMKRLKRAVHQSGR